MPDSKTPATESPARKGKARKYYVQEDPDSKPNSSDLLSNDSDQYKNYNYKHRRHNNKKKYWKCNKQDPIKLCTKLMAKLLITAYKSKVLKFT